MFEIENVSRYYHQMDSLKCLITIVLLAKFKTLFMCTNYLIIDILCRRKYFTIVAKLC